MKNRIYPFLLGLSCIVIVALVSFKNGEKGVEKEQMIVIARGYRGYEIFVSTREKREVFEVKTSEPFNYSELLSRLEEYQRQGWAISNSNMSVAPVDFHLYYTLEREKK